MDTRLPFSIDRPPASICILRLSALGDVTHILPIIHTLREYWPTTRITWVIGAFEYKLVGKLEDIKFVVFDKRGGWREFLTLRRALSARRFDLLLHMQVAFRANLASSLIKADVRIGYDSARSRDLHGLFVNRRIAARPRQHVIDGFFEFLVEAGLPKRTMRWTLPVDAADEQWADTIVDAERPVVIISPCSSHALRNWSASGYAAAASYAIEHYGAQVLLCGGPSALEADMADAIERRVVGECVNLVGKDTLGKLLSLLRLATVVISPDSGPAHLATCTDTPVLGLYAATNPRRSGPYKSIALCVDRFDVASRQFLRQPSDQLRWGTKIEKPGVMDLIDIDEVCVKLDEILSKKGR